MTINDDDLFLRREIKNIDEKWKLVPAFLETRGLVKQHLDSFDYLINHGLKKILRANKRIELDQTLFWEYEDIYVGPPDIEDGMRNYAVWPHECRLRDLTYSAPIKVDLIYVKENQLIRKKGQCIGRIPIMLRSSRCALSGASEATLFEKKECPLDPGGYFVIKGAEKVVLIQEQAAQNRILVAKDKTGGFACSVQSSSDESKTQTNLLQKKNKIFLKQNKLKDPVNVVIIFKALGIERDQEIAELVASEETTLALFAPSLFECQSLEIFSQAAAIKYLEKSIMRLTNPWTVNPGSARFQSKQPRNREQEVHDWLQNTLLVNVPVKDFNFYEKAVFLGLMVRRLLLAQQGIVKADDRDYYGNKRLQLAGDLISLLFEEHFKNFNDELRRLLLKKKDKTRTKALDIISEMNALQNRITTGMESAIQTGNWCLKRFKMDRKEKE